MNINIIKMNNVLILAGDYNEQFGGRDTQSVWVMDENGYGINRNNRYLQTKVVPESRLVS